MLKEPILDNRYELVITRYFGRPVQWIVQVTRR